MDEQEAKTKPGKPRRPEGVALAGFDEFLAASKRRYDEREIPGFGWLRIQNLSDLEVAEWELDGTDDSGTRPKDAMKLMKAALIVRCVVNDNGERRMSDQQATSVAGADGATVNAAFEFCREWCGIPRRDIDAMAALRAIQKNCEATAG